MKYLICIILVLIIVGCAVSKPVHLPDGQTGYTVDCSGTKLNWAYCAKKAGQLCKEKGYKILSVNGRPPSKTAYESPEIYYYSMAGRTMTISCNSN